MELSGMQPPPRYSHHTVPPRSTITHTHTQSSTIQACYPSLWFCYTLVTRLRGSWWKLYLHQRVWEIFIYKKNEFILGSNLTQCIAAFSHAANSPSTHKHLSYKHTHIHITHNTRPPLSWQSIQYFKPNTLSLLWSLTSFEILNLNRLTQRV